MRGQPDYLNPGYIVGASEFDTGAFFQGRYGFSPLDSKGRRLLVDAFDNGLHAWKLYQSSPDCYAIPVLWEASSFAGNPTLRFVADDPNEDAYLRKDYIATYPNRFGIEVAVQLPTGAGTVYVSLDYGIPGGGGYRGTLRYNGTEEALEIEQDGGDYVSVYDLSGIDYSVSGFHRFKLVVDFTTGKYVRLVQDVGETDLSGYNLRSDIDFGDRLVGACVGVDASVAGTPAWTHFGYVIVTDNEP